MKINVFGRKKGLISSGKRQFIKALNYRDIAAINSLIVELEPILGSQKLTELILNEVMIECDSQSHSWFCQVFLGQAQYEQMQEKAQSNIFQILVSKGLQPGKDFSSGADRSIIIGDRAKQVLFSQVPQQHQKAFEAQLETSLILDPVATIEQLLGCAFFSNLTEIVIQQIDLLSNFQAAAYLGVLLAGLVSRHPELQDADFPTRFIVNVLQGLPQERAMAILNDPQTNPQFDEMIIFGHLLTAMGDKEYHRLAEEDGGISLDQLKKLDLVWCGERRLSEMIAMMEKWQRRNS